MRDRVSRKTCSITVDIEESLDATDATATLVVDGAPLRACGHARKNPNDVAVPVIGEELAIGRALAALADELGERAAEAIEDSEQHPPLRWIGPGPR